MSLRRRVLYEFVKRGPKGEILHARLYRFDDGNAMAPLDGFAVRADGSTSAWEGARDDILAAGYLDMAEARGLSLIPLDWQPPPDPLRDEAKLPIELRVRFAGSSPTTEEIAAIRRVCTDLRDKPLQTVIAQLRGTNRYSLGNLWPAELERLEQRCWENGLDTVRVI